MAHNDRPATASRPFDRGRDGFVLGEGAWMVVLEREDRARARGATIYASSTATDRPATRITASRWRRTATRSCAPSALAIERSGRPRGRHRLRELPRTSTVLNDAVESRCVRQVFGDHAERLAGSSVKSMIGHPQGASGAAGVVTAALAMSRGVLPPTINLDDPDPACDLDFVPNAGRAAPRSKRRSATASALDPRTARWSSAVSSATTTMADRDCKPQRHAFCSACFARSAVDVTWMMS